MSIDIHNVRNVPTFIHNIYIQFLIVINNTVFCRISLRSNFSGDNINQVTILENIKVNVE